MPLVPPITTTRCPARLTALPPVPPCRRLATSAAPRRPARRDPRARAIRSGDRARRRPAATPGTRGPVRIGADRERLDPRSARHVAQAFEVDRGRLQRGHPDAHRVPARGQQAENVGEQLTAHAVDRELDRAREAVDPDHDLVGAELAQALRAHRATTQATTRAPARDASWTAKRPTPPEAPLISTDRPSTEPSPRIARRAVTAATGSAAASANPTCSGSTASSPGVDRAQPPPGSRPTERDHPRPGRGNAAVGGGGHDGPGGVPPRYVPVPVIGQERNLAEVQRDRRHLDERLGRCRIGRALRRGAARAGRRGRVPELASRQ